MHGRTDAPTRSPRLSVLTADLSVPLSCPISQQRERARTRAHKRGQASARVGAHAYTASRGESSLCRAYWLLPFLLLLGCVREERACVCTRSRTCVYAHVINVPFVASLYLLILLLLLVLLHLLHLTTPLPPRFPCLAICGVGRLSVGFSPSREWI